MRASRGRRSAFVALALASAAPAAAASAGAVDVSSGAVIRAAESIEGYVNPIEIKRLGSPEEVRLGRELFFDRRLSGDGTMSCATCHRPERAFTDGRARARGHGGRELPRNTPSLFGVTIAKPYIFGFFWDGRAASIQDVALTVIENPAELDNTPEHLAAVLGRDPGYVRRFKAVYGPGGPTAARAARALAAYIRSLAPTRPSAFDRAIDDPDALTRSQKRGLLLFAGKAGCSTCHWNPDMTSGEFVNLGLKPLKGLRDEGRFAVTRSDSDRRAFKMPSLRDVAVTAPYMHDGSLKTLADVVDFYNRGGDHQPGQDPRIRPLHLTDGEKRDLEDFLYALTSPPFKTPPPRRAGASPAPTALEAPRYWASAVEVEHDLEAAESLIDGLNARRRPWTQRPAYRGKRCAESFTPEKLVADEAAYRFDKGESAFLERYVSKDVTDYFKYRAFAERKPGLCDDLDYKVAPGTSYSGRYFCRSWFVTMSLFAGLLGPRDAFARTCREAAASDAAARPKAGALCALIGAHFDDPPAMCAALVPRFLSEDWVAECRVYFEPLKGRPVDCAPFAGDREGFTRCETVNALARAHRAGDPALCGGSLGCRVAMGEGEAVAAELASRIKAEVCRTDLSPRRGAAAAKKAGELLDRAQALLARAGVTASRSSAAPEPAYRQLDRIAGLRALLVRNGGGH
ncbi:MAG: hypothetical protein KGM24_01085 [Elusimicrobia bacterium]|nr:hypothetical protein [Elusimicrobiota bacterium]